MASSNSFHTDGCGYQYHPSCPCERCEAERLKSERYWTTNNLGYAIKRTSTHSTNSTASNLPGLGRTLGRGLSKLGRGFEKRLFRKAHRLGLGPNATAKRLESHLAKYDQEVNPSDREKTMEKIVKDCYRLLKYTEGCAFYSLIIVVTIDRPYLHQ